MATQVYEIIEIELLDGTQGQDASSQNLTTP